MRLLITGGAGYIGSVVATQLLEAGHHVTVVDDLSTGHRDAVPAGAVFVETDLLDWRPTRPVETAYAELAAPFDAVVHLAARSIVSESVRDPALYVRHNVEGALNLVDFMRRTGTARLVFSSTAAVYGEIDATPIDETAPTRPTNAYGASKLAVDQLLGHAASAYGLAAVSLRYFNVGGAYGAAGERHDVETHLIPRVLAVAVGQAAAIEVYGTDYPTRDGTAVRDYVHVVDLSQAHLRALAAAQPGEHRIYNLGNGEGFSVREVIDTAQTVTGRSITAVARPRRAGDPVRLVASSERARRELGWAPERGRLATIIEDAWAFLRDRS
jgi:UDP-glucose 4-epimerase